MILKMEIAGWIKSHLMDGPNLWACHTFSYSNLPTWEYHRRRLVENANIRNIGKGEVRHKKYKTLKLGGGQAEDRSVVGQWLYPWAVYDH